MRRLFFASVVVAAVLLIVLYAITRTEFLLWLLALVLLGALVGTHDALQKRRAVLRNFPVIGHFRYLLEMIRPEINQYFIESNTDGMPFDRETRSVVYQRSKRQLDTLPFGTQRDVYEQGYEWIAHSMRARPAPETAPRVMIGEGTCAQPYSASLLNISGMSYGALSKNAIRALNGGARAGGFFHNTGEGGLSPYHLEGGGDLMWQIGTGYFGCRKEDGHFDPDAFEKAVAHPSVKLIEIKLSQGAKPGHGGILPAVKLTPEIAEIRGVPLGRDVLSPPAHTSFTTPRELMAFLAMLREISGTPVGIKLCVGSQVEVMSLCRAMRETETHPDFIAVDGGEGGTGAAPLEFSNSVGMPLDEGLFWVHNCLVGFDLRDRVRLIASGKITSGFDMLKRLALGADLCASARAMMLALGCIQARRCNANDCPVGVATQKPGLVYGLDVESKAERVHHYHHATVHSLLELVGAAGLASPSAITPRHVMRRIDDNHVRSYAEIFPFLESRALLTDPVPAAYEHAWLESTAGRF